MLLTLPPQNFHIVAVFLLFLDKNEKLCVLFAACVD